MVFDLEVPNAQDVLGDEASYLTGAIANTKFGAILLVGRRSRGVIFLVKIAGNRAAGGAWNPEVGAASVEDDLEFLGRRAESNGAEVCV